MMKNPVPISKGEANLFHIKIAENILTDLASESAKAKTEMDCVSLEFSVICSLRTNSTSFTWNLQSLALYL